MIHKQIIELIEEEFPEVKKEKLIGRIEIYLGFIIQPEDFNKIVKIKSKHPMIEIAQVQRGNSIVTIFDYFSGQYEPKVCN